jgi:hypothetical protein
MRPAPPIIAAFALATAGLAFAQGAGSIPSTSGTPGPGAPSSQNGSNGPGMGSESSPTGTGAMSGQGNASSATSSGANASATATPSFQVGEPVRDNTGATIGSISQLNPGPNGSQMAVIKMGNDTFQVPADRLGSDSGAATINLTQAQIANMIHPAAGAGTGAAGASEASPSR